VGGSFTLAFILFAFLGIRSLRDSDLAKLATSSLYAAQVPVFVPAIPVTTGAAVKQNFMTSATTVVMPVTSRVAPKVATLETQFAMLESLRQEVHINERAFRAQMPSEDSRTIRRVSASLAVAEISSASADR
jgi:hypothetical protein